FLGAYLSGADLTGANLQNSRLSGATLQRAFLTGASLRNARLNGVNLAGVDFRAADLSGVEMENLESIAGADFTQVQGLSDRLRHVLLSRSGAELDTWNVFTRRTTRQSLSIE
uniref:pentapeptide repeat-containing protein n=1 Tax=Chamaesiphon sp. OTE_8_metabat_110 TaxID=2964696 RepID=UPI00286A6C28